MRKWLLPEYIEDILPVPERRIESLRRGMLDLFERHGYQLVLPPTLEYVDSLLTGTGHDLDLKTFKLVDQLSGRTMGVRADITPQVARIDAHLLNKPGATRLCYCGTVLHTRPRGLYATLFVGIFDPSSRRLRYVNAGHNPQFAVRHTPSGTVIDRLSSAGTPIGLLPGHGYTQREIQLAAGDHLFFYTDGVVETENAQGDQFGPERLEHLLLTTTVTSADGPDAILQSVEAEIKTFRGDTEPFDDATTMVVKIG